MVSEALTDRKSVGMTWFFSSECDMLLSLTPNCRYRESLWTMCKLLPERYMEYSL
jgi:hypothetical protein